jgi:hypothetical protein
MAQGPVLVVDFGAQYAQLIARRVREAHVYSELVPHSMPVEEILAKDPRAIILSGGPASVFEPGAPGIDPKIFDAGIPVWEYAMDSRSWHMNSVAKSIVQHLVSTAKPLRLLIKLKVFLKTHLRSKVHG